MKNWIIKHSLVGGLEHFLFSIVYGIILPNWLIFFKMAKTTNQIYILIFDASWIPTKWWLKSPRCCVFSMVFPAKLQPYFGDVAIFHRRSIQSQYPKNTDFFLNLNHGLSPLKDEIRRDSHRIYGAAIYGNMDPINIPQMLAYIYILAPWILWDMNGYDMMIWLSPGDQPDRWVDFLYEQKCYWWSTACKMINMCKHM